MALLLCEKFKRITGPVITKEAQEEIISAVTKDENRPIRKIVDLINTKEFWK